MEQLRLSSSLVQDASLPRWQPGFKSRQPHHILHTHKTSNSDSSNSNARTMIYTHFLSNETTDDDELNTVLE